MAFCPKVTLYPLWPSRIGAPRIRRSIRILNPEDEAGRLNRQIEKRLLAGKRERFRQMDPQELGVW